MPLITGVREDSYLLMNFDESISGNIPDIVASPGTASISTTVSKVGGGSLYLYGTYLTLAAMPKVFNFLSDDFTIAFWIRPVMQLNQYLAGISIHADAANSQPAGVVFGYSDVGQTYISGTYGSWNIASAGSSGGAVLPLNTWTHLEITRSGENFYIFRNGVKQSTWKSTLSVYCRPTSPIYIGCYSPAGTPGMNGYIDELLVIRGKALHTDSFTPPEDPYVIETLATPLTLQGIDLGCFDQADRSSNKPSYDFSELNPIGDLTRKIKPVIRVEQLEGVGFLTRKTKSVIRVEQLEGVGSRVQGLRVLNEDLVMGLDTGLRDSIKLAYEFPLLDSADREPSVKSSFELEVFDFDTNLNNEFNLLVTPTHQHRDQAVHVQVTSTKVEAVMGKYKVLVGNIVLIPYGENDVDVRNLEFSINPSDLVPGVNLCKVEYFGDSSGYVQFKLIKEALKRESVERTFLPYDGGYKTDNVMLTGKAQSIGAKYIQTYTVSNLGSGRKFTIKLGNYVEKVEVL